MGGAAGGLPLALGELAAENLAMCMLCKVFLTMGFVAIYVALGALCKKRMVVAVCLGLVVGVLMFMTIPALTPLDAGVANVAVCLVGGVALSLVLGAVGTLALARRDIL